MRRVVQVHLWVAVISGLYIVVVCLTGAALVFRVDMQRARAAVRWLWFVLALTPPLLFVTGITMWLRP